MVFNTQVPIPRCLDASVVPRMCAAISAALLSRSQYCQLCQSQGPTFPRCWQRLFYVALPGKRHYEQSRRFYARIWHALLWAGCDCVVLSSSVFSKNVEAANSWSFDTEKCITEMNNCKPFGTAGDLRERERGERKKNLCLGGIVREIHWKLFFLFINSDCNNAPVRTSSSTSITSTD